MNLLNTFFDKIILLDKIIFFFLNQRFHNPLFDFLFPFFRAPWFWIPLYLFLILWIILNFNKRDALLWILFFLLIVSLCDIVSSHVIKQTIYRMRPCFDPIWLGKVRHLTTYCSSSSSFTSSHAANHFGMAFFISFSLKKYFKKFTTLFFIWAFLVCYAQVYVGVHYPLDVFFGALLGFIIAWIGYQQYSKILHSHHNKII